MATIFGKPLIMFQWLLLQSLLAEAVLCQKLRRRHCSQLKKHLMLFDVHRKLATALLEVSRMALPLFNNNSTPANNAVALVFHLSGLVEK